MCYLPYERGGPYPGLFLFTQSARLMRPVRQVFSRQQELIGSLEQSTMHIRCAVAACAVLCRAPSPCRHPSCVQLVMEGEADDDAAHSLTG